MEHDTTDVPTEAAEAPAQAAEAPDAEPEARERVAPTALVAQRLLADLRSLTERGKAQWDQALARARQRVEATREAEALAEPAEAGAETDLAEPLSGPSLLKRAREQGRAWLTSEPVSRAQHRGAELLLDLVSRARAGIERLEANLREAATSEESAAPAA